MNCCQMCRRHAEGVHSWWNPDTGSGNRDVPLCGPCARDEVWPRIKDAVAVQRLVYQVSPVVQEGGQSGN